MFLLEQTCGTGTEFDSFSAGGAVEMVGFHALVYTLCTYHVGMYVEAAGLGRWSSSDSAGWF